MPEAANEQQPAVPGVQAPPPKPDDNRAQVYNQLYGQPPAPVAPAAPTSTDVDALKVQNAELKAQLDQIVQSLQAQVKPAEPAAPPVPDWFDLLQAGKRTEAEQRLIEQVTAGAATQVQQRAVSQAIEVARIEREIESFNNAVRAENSDLLDVEDFVTAKAQQHFTDTYQKTPPKNAKEYTDLYRRSVTQAVNDVRTVLQRTRAAAKNEALTTSREVLAASTVAPNDFQVREMGNRQQTEQPAQPPLDPKNYISERQQRSYRYANPGVGQQ